MTPEERERARAESLADCRRAMAADVAWRKAGGPGRVHTHGMGTIQFSIDWKAGHLPEKVVEFRGRVSGGAVPKWAR